MAKRDAGKLDTVNRLVGRRLFALNPDRDAGTRPEEHDQALDHAVAAPAPVHGDGLC
jgi:hypothetical protein